MDLSIIGSLFIYAAEEAMRSSAIQLTFDLSHTVDRTFLFEAYREAILSHRELSKKFFFDEKTQTYLWLQLTQDEIEKSLSDTHERIMGSRAVPHLENSWFATGEGLPFAILKAVDRTVVFYFNHVAFNGFTAFYWVDHILAIYSEKKDGIKAAQRYRLIAKQQNRLLRLSKNIKAVVTGAAYLVWFFSKMGRNASKRTVDLSRGRHPLAARPNYVCQSYALGVEDTQRFRARYRKQSMLKVALIAGEICEILKDRYADQKCDRLLFSVPFDLTREIGVHDLSKLGNRSGSLAVQVTIYSSIEKQIQQSLKWWKRGAVYGISMLLSAFNSPNIAKAFRIASWENDTEMR